MTKNIKKKSWMRWLVFLAGLEIIAISINFFYGPINIAAGGSTGISILVDAVWGINRSITSSNLWWCFDGARCFFTIPR